MELIGGAAAAQKTGGPGVVRVPSSVNDLIPRFNQIVVELSQWFEDHWIELTAAAIVATLLYLTMSWGRRRAAKWSEASESQSALTTIVARAFARTTRFFRIMVALQVVNGFAGAPTIIARSVDILFTIAVVLQSAIWLREIILGLVERRAGDGEHEHDTLASAMVLIRLLVSFAVFAIAAIVILDNLGINVTGLVAGLGVGGIAIGLAAQGIFSDLFAAISIIFDKPFKRGDTVSYDTTTARVEKIGMKSTRLRALTGEEKIISNSKLLDKEITNNTQTIYRRVTFLLNLVYHTPPATASGVPDILREIVEANGFEFIRSGFNTFGPSSLDFHLVFDVNSDDVEEMFRARHAVGIGIVERFAKEGIEFAYPTQTTYTASPDGTLVMPYATPVAQPKSNRKGDSV